MLKAMQDKFYLALKAVTQDDPEGPYGEGPFTGNTRESREVVALQIKFSGTRGGSPGVDMSIDALGIEAWPLGKFLEAQILSKLKEIQVEIEKL